MELKLRHAVPLFALPDHRAIREFPGYKLSKLTESVFIKITKKLITTNPTKKKESKNSLHPFYSQDEVGRLHSTVKLTSLTKRVFKFGRPSRSRSFSLNLRPHSSAASTVE